MHEEQAQAKEISLVVLSLPQSMTKDSKSDSRHYSTISILRNCIDNLELNVACGTHLEFPSSSFAQFSLLRNVSFYPELEYWVDLALQ